MTRKKRKSSSVLDKAEVRASAMESIQSDLDLGNGLTLEAYRSAINNVREKQNQYNKTLSSLDSLYSELLFDEGQLGEMSDHMLSAVKVKFGRNSYEYEMAGGVRRSERKRPQRKAVATSA